MSIFYITHQRVPAPSLRLRSSWPLIGVSTFQEWLSLVRLSRRTSANQPLLRDAPPLHPICSQKVGCADPLFGFRNKRSGHSTREIAHYNCTNTRQGRPQRGYRIDRGLGQPGLRQRETRRRTIELNTVDPEGIPCCSLILMVPPPFSELALRYSAQPQC